jgi:hypothetical protein
MFHYLSAGSPSRQRRTDKAAIRKRREEIDKQVTADPEFGTKAQGFEGNFDVGGV